MESTTATKNPVLIYTEQTPNPESLKFVTNKMLYAGTADFRTRELADEYSPLAAALFDLGGKFGPTAWTLYAFAVFIFQIFFSYTWLRFFNFGPVEWLWRSMTYKKWQPMRKTKLPVQ